MSTAIRWIVAAAAIVLVVALLGWARGDKHHRGDEIGSSLGPHATAVDGR
jgi:hypothetical protein